MAELPRIRRVGGSLESHRAPAGMRVLLPAEIELCEAVGLTEQEYWDFVQLNEAYNGERSEAYAHIPDVRNDPVTIVVNIVIGIALSAVASLLAPKPRTPSSRGDRKQPGALQTEDQTSGNRYAPQSSFDSIQQLASLGSVIPLVYCKYRTGDGRGGVRVNSTLLWSYMTTLGRNQQLRALMLFSHGTIESRPDYAGYAIGDLLIENYALGKAELFFATGAGKRGNPSNNRFLQSDAYSKGEMEQLAGGTTRDPFAVEWGTELQQYFSGSRTPTTQSTFGTYAAMPNGTAFKVNYELVLNISTSQLVQDSNDAKKAKINKLYQRYAYIYGPVNAQRKQSNVGDVVTYIIDGYQYPTGRYLPWGTNDVQQALDEGRFEADGNLIVGETYMIGTGFGVCIKKQCIDVNGNPSNRPWGPGLYLSAEFRLTTSAVYDTFDNPNEINGPGDKFLIQRAAVATISNNRACDRTDLLIKSTVYRKINGFTNVNSEPDDGMIREYERNDSPITLGSMNVYNKRLSFFGLEYRNIGETTWRKMIANDVGFCVVGRTLEAAYNMISIYHPSTKQFEYQLKPLAGNVIKENKMYFNFYFLEAASSFDNNTKLPKTQSFQYSSPDGTFLIYYTGQPRTLTPEMSSNGEWVIKGYNSSGNIPENYNLRYTDAIQDFVLFNEEELSNSIQPEHEIVAINELSGKYRRSGPAQYTDLAYAGIRLNSGVEWSSFNELSAYFKNGIKVIKSPFKDKNNLGATNLLPEIAYDLLSNTDYGVGDSVGGDQIDKNEMAVAANFCNANGFYWDGVIGDRSNIREWIYENAGYCLLQFRIKGGRFGLYPDVPFDSRGNIEFAGGVNTSTIFTDSTMSDLKVSFLSPEERQLFKATVLWRQDTVNGFPQTRTVTVRLNASSENVPEETFDMSGFCTSEEHAVTFAKYALKIREKVDHGISFQTTPQMAMGLEPGEYFKVATAVAHPTSSGISSSRFKNGSIDSSGSVSGLNLEDGSYNIQYWMPGTEGLRETNIQVSNGIVNNNNVRGAVFALSAQSSSQTRTYKVESLTYGEDGLVEVAGSFTPLTSGGALEVLQWDGQFAVTYS